MDSEGVVDVCSDGSERSVAPAAAEMARAPEHRPVQMATGAVRLRVPELQRGRVSYVPFEPRTDEPILDVNQRPKCRATRETRKAAFLGTFPQQSAVSGSSCDWSIGPKFCSYIHSMKGNF